MKPLWTGLTAATLLAMAAAAPAGNAEEPVADPRWDFIAFEVKGWGETRSSWRIAPGVGGSWTEARKEKGDPLGTYTLVWHAIEQDPQLYRTLEEVLSKLPQPAPDPNECERFIPDMAYGTLRLTKGATTTEIAWDSGCFDDDYRAFMTTLREADTLVAEAGRAGEVMREERFPKP